ncbi:MAG: UbiA family prenyltransferase [Bacteroidia bacterium]|nr:UbiA family prenyltransferase [Bacteroidia bacterium]MDW8346401.1 UbiA family prenyltransferase [Bacteroidia bacterium]
MNKIKRNTSPTILQNLKVLIKTSRPFLWVNTAYTFGFSYIMAALSFKLEGTVPYNLLTIIQQPFFVVSLFFFLIPYNIILYGVNDVFDYETDLKNARKLETNLEGKVLSPEYHSFILWTSAMLAIIFGIIYTLYLDFNLIVYTSLLVVALAYSVKPIQLKGRPFWDFISSSFHYTISAFFALYYFYDARQFHISQGIEVEYVSLWCLLPLFVWGFSSHILGAIPDMAADKNAGLRTTAVVLGKRLSLVLVFVFYSVASVLFLYYFKWWALGTVLYPFLVWIKNDNQRNRYQIYLNYVNGAVITIILVIKAVLPYFIK